MGTFAWQFLKHVPGDFMFQLTADEAKDWLASRFQIGTLKRGYNLKYLPYGFTQEGVARIQQTSQSNLWRRLFLKKDFQNLKG